MNEIGKTVEINQDEIYNKLIEREKTSTTALSPFFAVPHVILEGENIFELLIMRSKKGIYFSDVAPNVHSLFFLLGTMDQRHFHLVALSAIAQIVQDSTFETNWLKAVNTEELRKLILSSERKREKKDEQD